MTYRFGVFEFDDRAAILTRSDRPVALEPQPARALGLRLARAGDVASLDTSSGELRLIEIKGLAGETGTVALTPNEKRVAEDRRDCYWLYVVTRCQRPDGPQVMSSAIRPGCPGTR